MGMWTTENQDTMEVALKVFSEAAHKNFGSHDYTAGYLCSLVVEMLPHMPKRQQKELINSIVDAARRQERLFLARQTEVDKTAL